MNHSSAASGPSEVGTSASARLDQLRGPRPREPPALRLARPDHHTSLLSAIAHWAILQEMSGDASLVRGGSVDVNCMAR
ncbi:hypothetical protein M514_27724 [Trichuris suis]|uniref:Uncharacterized protein n=2 Tax=Trichuris suis TaxID=68888 RepID=A0A085MSB2_9BILA|nr:hypothetical protein M514_27724 [Trichuris suis]